MTSAFAHRDWQAAPRAIGGLEDLARLDSPVHRLDARVKVLVTLFFALTAISFSKYSLTQLVPLIFYPVVVIALAGLPAGLLMRRLLVAAPFVLLLGAANPLLDRLLVAHIGPLAVTGGWLSFGSIAVRLALTLLAALLLTATAGIHDICRALERLGMPRALASQILFLYRYLFVLMDEAGRLLRAHELRGGGRSIPLKLAGPLLGQWLLRSIDRARRIHQAMLARGFDGEFRRLVPARPSRFDALWLAGWSAFFLLVRFTSPADVLGRFFLELLGR